MKVESTEKCEKTDNLSRHVFKNGKGECECGEYMQIKKYEPKYYYIKYYYTTKNNFSEEK
jgi:hypothetical protein